MELRVNGEVRQESHSSRMSVTIPEILSNFSALGYSAGDVLSTGTVAGVAGLQVEGGARAPLPEARRRDRGGDRADRRPAQPGRSRGRRGTARRRRRGCARGARTLDLAPRRREARARPRADGRARARRTRRARARQRPLPDELLGDEGLRRVRLPARGRAGADHASKRRPRTPRARRGRPTCASSAATRTTIRGRCRRARSTRRSRRRRTTAASASSSRSARRRPTGWSASRRRSRRRWFDAWPDAQRRDAGAERGTRDQDRRRRSSGMRLANEICAAAMEHVRGELRPGMKESEAAAIWQGFVHGEGTGWQGKVELALGFSLVWSGPGHQDVHGDRRPCRCRRDEPTLFEIWVCADGYWCRPHEAPLPRRAARRTTASSRRACSTSTSARSRTAGRARASPSSTGWCATGSPRSAIRASRRTRSATASARARTSRRTRTRRAAARSRRAWCSRSSRAATGTAAAGCASRTTS